MTTLNDKEKPLYYKHQLETVLQKRRESPMIYVYGGRGTGKSWFLQKLKKNLLNENKKQKIWELNGKSFERSRQMLKVASKEGTNASSAPLVSRTSSRSAR